MKVSSHRLDCYAAIAACGSGAVGLAVSPLHGDVQYFGTEMTFGIPGERYVGTAYTSNLIAGGGVSWALSGSRTARAGSIYWNSGASSSIYRISEFGYFTNAWFVDAPRHNSDRLFDAGHVIDSATIGSGSGLNDLNIATGSWYHFFRSVEGDVERSGTSFDTESSGILAAGQRGFLALSWDLDGKAVFGWADISLSADGLSLTLHGWAFEDSGEAIIAGQTEGGGTPVPGLGGLAALACGAAGMRRKRGRVA